MKRFEMKSDDPDRYFIAMIDAKIGDVMYIRRGGKIVAVMFLSAMVDVDDNGDLVGSVLLLDAEKGCRQYVSVYSQCMYRSVEDCRKKENEIDIIELDPLLVAKSAGLEVVGLKNGRPVFDLFKWDGFYPQKVGVGMDVLDITFDGESWKCDSVNGPFYYRTFEECEADNHVEVVLFPGK